MSTTRLDQLPAAPQDLARTVAELRRELDAMRAQRPDMSAADAMLPPLDIDPTRWPQTTSGTYTTIARCSAVCHGARLHLVLDTATSGTATGLVRALVAGIPWGTPATAGSQFEYAGPLPPGVTVGTRYDLTVEAQRTGGTGSILAQTRLIRSLLT